MSRCACRRRPLIGFVADAIIRGSSVWWDVRVGRMSGLGSSGVWPELTLAAWRDTRDTLLLWSQVVGKIRMANTPTMNHWWNVPLYVTARGLTTGLIPHGARSFQIDFDFLADRLDIAATDGASRSLPLEPRSVADFYREVMGALDDLGLSTEIWTMPVEIAGASPLDLDEGHAAYDRDAVHRFWLALVQMD